jgi:hypothetical protein
MSNASILHQSTRVGLVASGYTATHTAMRATSVKASGIDAITSLRRIQAVKEMRNHKVLSLIVGMRGRVSRLDLAATLMLGLVACGQVKANHSSDSTVAVVQPSSYLAPSRGGVSVRSVAPGFATYEEAIDWVRNTSGLFCESTDTERSSWINSAEFCSDGSGTGYVIVGLRGKEYIHAGVPESVWRDFTGAPSLGRFYDYNIRGRYRLELEGE